MTRTEFADYEESVREFMAREGIENLTSGHYECPECHLEFEDRSLCPSCEQHKDLFDEPYFSWNRCDCCDRNEGGDREFATGFNPTTGEVQEYSICEDCAYYAEYGRLNDRTMLEVENSV